VHGRPGVAGSGCVVDEISPYLHGYAMRAARHFGHGTQASITFRHHGAIVRAASSDDSSARCDQVEALTDDGPCVLAMDELRAVLVPRIDRDPRWVDWREQASTEGFVSGLAMPAQVAPGMDVAINLYSPVADPWDAKALTDADSYAQRIAHAMSLAIHLTAPDVPRIREDLTGPEIIGRAVSATMQCNGCTADEALQILLSASTHRNVGLEEVAATVLLALTGVSARPSDGRTGSDT
jgi:hypothetical protein